MSEETPSELPVPGIEDLRGAVHELFVREAKSFGVDPSSLAVSYVLNRGGFVNHSFRVTDGRTRYHVKLATSDDARSALRRWHRLDLMLRRYRAPPVLGWIEVGSCAGLLFAAVDGIVPGLTADVLREVGLALTRLAADTDVAAELARAERVTAADAYVETYDDRFMADLAAIRAARPPFLSSSDLDRLEEEAHDLAARVRSDEAFTRELDSPVHGDPWLDNILWQGPAAWHLLDWDDVRIGDPAIDLAMLMGPDSTDLTPLKRVSEVEAAHPSLSSRLPLLGRASLLDWVIDPIADWIEADVAPASSAAVRKEKARVHRAAWSLYRELYGS